MWKNINKQKVKKIVAVTFIVVFPGAMTVATVYLLIKEKSKIKDFTLRNFDKYIRKNSKKK